MRKLLLALCVLLPTAGHCAPPEKLSYREYSKEIDRLGAACVVKNLPKYNGMCVSKGYGDATETALSVSLALHRFVLFLERCGVPEPPGWKAAKNGAFKIANVKMFFDEMAPQTEALEVYSRYSNECKSASENEVDAGKSLQWLTYMAAKYSDEGKQLAAQAEQERHRQRSQAEKDQWETDPWFVGTFSGRSTLEKGSINWSLRCVMGEECELIMTNPGSTAQAIPMRVPVRRDATIPNNNLRGTREAVRERPDFYRDSREGPMLVPLRPLLSSQAHFERCVDIAAETDVALCSLSTDPKASKTLVLLLGTMKGSCGDSPFCAYYFQLLEREKGS